jgi:hypothetical protein
MACLLVHHCLRLCLHLPQEACPCLPCPPLGLHPQDPLDLPSCPHQLPGSTPLPRWSTLLHLWSIPPLQGSILQPLGSTPQPQWSTPPHLGSIPLLQGSTLQPQGSIHPHRLGFTPRLLWCTHLLLQFMPRLLECTHQPLEYTHRHQVCTPSLLEFILLLLGYTLSLLEFTPQILGYIPQLLCPPC